MSLYTKKPVTIEASRWFKHGDHAQVGRANGDHFKQDGTCRVCGATHEVHGEIDTLEGQNHTVCPGDWIIKGVKGEFYACKPDIFEATYDCTQEPSAKPSEGTLTREQIERFKRHIPVFEQPITRYEAELIGYAEEWNALCDVALRGLSKLSESAEVKALVAEMNRVRALLTTQEDLDSVDAVLDAYRASREGK